MELAGGDDHHHHHQISRRSRGNSNNNNNNNVAVYKECLRNHAASLGSYATDGCGEFTPEDMTNNNLQCAACGCHRNFHRKLVLLESQQQQVSESPSSAAAAAAAEMSDRSGGSSGKKRVRTKFSEEQKEKMLELAEKVGWKMQRRNEINNNNVDEIEQFCKEVGITRQVFKVWMHNHKNSNSNSSSSSATSSSVVAATSLRICTANHPTADHQFI